MLALITLARVPGVMAHWREAMGTISPFCLLLMVANIITRQANEALASIAEISRRKAKGADSLMMWSLGELPCPKQIMI